MVWVYIVIILLSITFSIIYKVKNIRAIRVFGFELLQLLFCLLILIFIIGEFVVPMPQYHIKKGRSLNEVLEEETLKAGIEFDEGSLKILDSHGMHFNHLFLYSYEIGGREEVRFYHFKKNILGNMKPRSPLDDIHIITDRKHLDDHYRSYIEDGLFAGYLVTVGYGEDTSEPINYGLNQYRISRTPQEGYFMWVEMANEPWKSNLVKFALYAFISYIIFKLKKDKTEPIKFYRKRRKRDKWYTILK